MEYYLYIYIQNEYQFTRCDCEQMLLLANKIRNFQYLHLRISALTYSLKYHLATGFVDARRIKDIA